MSYTVGGSSWCKGQKDHDWELESEETVAGITYEYYVCRVCHDDMAKKK